MARAAARVQFIDIKISSILVSKQMCYLLSLFSFRAATPMRDVWWRGGVIVYLVNIMGVKHYNLYPWGM